MTLGIIGLGRMGMAIGEAAINAKLEPTVWNRNAARSRMLAGRARIADSPADLIKGSEMIILVLPDYATTESVLRASGVGEVLEGKTLIQLCSGTPSEARHFHSFATEAGASYIDGKIFTYPARVGTDTTRFVYAGDEKVFERCAKTLAAFGARSTWLGSDPGFAAAADLAWLSYLYGSMAGLFQGLAFTRAEGLGDEAVFGSVPSWLVEIDAEARYSKALIDKADFRGDQATIDVHLAAMQHLVDTATTQGVSAAFPAVILDVFKKAVSHGLGGLEIAAAVEAFRTP